MMRGIEASYILSQLTAQKVAGIGPRHPHQTLCREIEQDITLHCVRQFGLRITEVQYAIARKRRARLFQECSPIWVHSPLLKIQVKAS